MENADLDEGRHFVEEVEEGHSAAKVEEHSVVEEEHSDEKDTVVLVLDIQGGIPQADTLQDNLDKVVQDPDRETLVEHIA